MRILRPTKSCKSKLFFEKRYRKHFGQPVEKVVDKPKQTLEQVLEHYRKEKQNEPV